MAVFKRYITWKQLNGWLDSDRSSSWSGDKLRVQNHVLICDRDVAGGSSWFLEMAKINVKVGHKYFLLIRPYGTTQTGYYQFYITGITSSYNLSTRFFTFNTAGEIQLQFACYNSEPCHTKYTVMFFDLTEMYGEGTEPATIEEAEAAFPLPYYMSN